MKLTLRELATQSGLRDITKRVGYFEYLLHTWKARRFIWRYSVAKINGSASQNNLGLLWEFLDPLLLSIAYYLVFGVVLDLKRDSSNFPLFLIAGVLTWKLFSATLTGAVRSSSRKGEQDLLESIHLPHLVIPISNAVQNALRAIPVVILLFPAALFMGETPHLAWLLLPFVLLWVALTGFAIGLLLNPAVKRIPDLDNLIKLGLRMMFFLTGVFFSVEKRFASAPDSIQLLANYNPSAVLLEMTRTLFLFDVNITSSGIIWILTFTLVTLFVASLNFWRTERRVG
ncbi:MAG: ABC transporter permease [Candidatus Nanopelagicales bacterium]